MQKKITVIIKSCKECPFYKTSPGQGAWDHVCEKRKKYLESEFLDGKRIHPDCTLEDDI